ncbi:hypothetical protein GTU79_24520 [Sodalis ligni]|uniref:hypothetical protein n=1 Tax=Sodalis ligni TaxID=2697027 RepID=UPI001BDE58EE|nr:hypothetical protein [Sodalis ligni]QWA10353.1 hypothetical protein GTU79_24520 [Sodalis ligni]
MEKNKPAEVKYIKLGQCGEWEAECIESGFIKFGYHETPHELCLSEKWDEVREVWKISGMVMKEPLPKMPIR